MKVTLQVNGREMTFSEEELSSILEEHFTKNGEQPKKKKTQFSYVPTEGKCFEVKPKTINRQLFVEQRENLHQERIRKIIMEAFKEVDYNSTYAKSFTTVIPEKTWYSPKKVFELKQIANTLGGRMANWVEQALEWAQRISDGETWENLCAKGERDLPHRLVIWKDGKVKLVGGCGDMVYSATSYSIASFNDERDFSNLPVVPLVVIYQK